MTSDAQTALVPPPDFVERVRALGVEFEPGDVERLGRFLGMLLEANKVTNLTAITDPEQAWTKHILDALTIVPVLASVVNGTLSASEGSRCGANEPEVKTPASDPSLALRVPSPSVIDIGSGGGMPAIPLAIVMPDVRFTMVEATGKKAEFLDRTISELGLMNARVILERAEQS